MPGVAARTKAVAAGRGMSRMTTCSAPAAVVATTVARPRRRWKKLWATTQPITPSRWRIVRVREVIPEPATRWSGVRAWPRWAYSIRPSRHPTGTTATATARTGHQGPSSRTTSATTGAMTGERTRTLRTIARRRAAGPCITSTTLTGAPPPRDSVPLPRPPRRDHGHRDREDRPPGPVKQDDQCDDGRDDR